MEDKELVALVQRSNAGGMSLAGCLAVAVVTMVAALLLKKSKSKKSSSSRLPPGPVSLPVIGHLHLVRPPVHRTFHELAARLGPLLHIRLGSTLCIIASSANVASELIRSHEAKISERPLTAVARQFAYDSAGFAFAPYDQHWRFMKRLCMSELLGPRTVEQLRPIRRAELAGLLQAIASASASGKAVDLTRELIRLSNTAIIRMVASTAPATVTEEAQGLVKVVAELVGAFNVDDYIAVCRGWDLQGLGRRARDVHRRFDALLEEMIRRKEETRHAAARQAAADDSHKDLLDILLDKADDEHAEVKLTRDNIKAFIIDVVTAGSDTSAAMVEWMLAELINHPDALRKVRDEIDAVVGKDRVASEADLASLPYLQAALKESLRLHPAAPIAHRQSTEEIHIRGCTIPPQAAVFINIWSIGRDPAYWEDPSEFRPERFLPGGAGAGVEPRGQHFQLMPFGSGRRGCPGVGLGMQVVPAVLAALVQCFDWTVEGKIDMEEADGLVCARKQPLVVVPASRLNPFPVLD